MKKQPRFTSIATLVLMAVALIAFFLGMMAPNKSKWQVYSNYTCDTYTKGHLTSYECDKN